MIIDDDDDFESDDKGDKVACYFDGHAMEAIMVFENGHFEPATLYCPGVNGFAMAYWTGEIEDSLELDLPNNSLILQDDGVNWKIKPYEIPKPADKKKQ